MNKLLIVVLLVLNPVCTSWANQESEQTKLSEGMKPWWPSRYGKDDQLGTLNEVTSEVTASATKLVKTGTIVDLGRILDDGTPKFPGRYWHQTADTTPLFTNQRRLDAVLADAVPVKPELCAPPYPYSAPDFMRRGTYLDMHFVCKDCGKDDIWSATQQKWWYETANGDIYSVAVRCRPCRKAERARKAQARRVHLEGIEKKRQTLAKS